MNVAHIPRLLLHTGLRITKVSPLPSRGVGPIVPEISGRGNGVRDALFTQMLNMTGSLSSILLTDFGISIRRNEGEPSAVANRAGRGACWEEVHLASPGAVAELGALGASTSI